MTIWSYCSKRTLLQTERTKPPNQLTISTALEFVNAVVLVIDRGACLDDPDPA